MNHAISVVGSWIFDSNYERALFLNKASLYMICAPSVGEEQASIFEKKLLFCQIHLYWSAIEERITLICPQKRQSESFVLIY